jgi:pilus assembly protein Flp/PilA
MIQRFWILTRLVLRDQQGAAAIEYGLLAALVAVALFAGAQLLGTNLGTLFNNIATFLASVLPLA